MAGDGRAVGKVVKRRNGNGLVSVKDVRRAFGPRFPVLRQEHVASGIPEFGLLMVKTEHVTASI